MAASRTPHAIAEPHMFSFDDNTILKYIPATHAPDGTYFDVKPFLEIIEKIVRANQFQERTDPILFRPGFIYCNDDVNEILEVMALTINNVSCEISSKCIESGDVHTTTMGIFNMLSNYAWDEKAVITLSAFAVKYGEFLLVAYSARTANPLARWLTRLKKMPDVLDDGDEALKLRFEGVNNLKLQFEGVSNLLTPLLDLTRCIIKFKELPEQYISPEIPELQKAITHIASAVYWIIRSIVACASILINLTGKGIEEIMKTTDGWKLSSLADKISNFHDNLKDLLRLCYEHIEEKRQPEAYPTILRIMDSQHSDNMMLLKHLIYFKEDQLPLYESSTKNRVSLEILKKKIVLLLISDLDLPPKELSVLQDHMYRQAKQDPTRSESQYDVVWLPMVPNQWAAPWNKANQIQFEALRNMMPWYSVFHPSLLEPAGIKYIEEVWHFNKKPLLVVMDPQGRIINTNALHMMWIWGSLAFPFTSLREEALWKEETWRIELILDSIEPMIFNWIADGRYICLYGGEDIEWIRKFTNTARVVARTAGIPLEMLCVGKSTPGEKVRKNIDIIQAENLSYVLDMILIRLFWVRLESMLYSKLQHGNSFDEDPIFREITVMLTYDGNDQCWAVIYQGSNDWIRRANGDTVLTSLNNYKDWKDEAKERGFLPALNEHLEANRPPHHCNCLILPGTIGSVPDRVVCAECGQC